MDLIQQLLVDLKVQGNSAGAVEYQVGRLLFSSLENRTINAHNGHCQEFCRLFEKARQLDPLSLIIHSDEAMYLAADHQTDRAIQLLKRAIDLDPEFAEAHRVLAVVYTQKAEMPLAIAEARQAATLDPNNYSQTTLGYVYAKAGEPRRSEF